MNIQSQYKQYSHLMGFWIRSALPQGTFQKDALQAPVWQDTTLMPLLELDHGHSSFASSEKGSEVGGRFLYSMLFLKPQLQKQQKNQFHSFFSPDSSTFWFCLHQIFLVCIERKIYSGRENIVKIRKIPTQLWRRLKKLFQV